VWEKSKKILIQVGGGKVKRTTSMIGVGEGEESLLSAPRSWLKRGLRGCLSLQGAGSGGAHSQDSIKD